MSAARLTIRANADLPSLYSDSRTHLPQGGNIQQPGDPSATRNVRLPRATQSGGIISKSEDGLRCVVGGREYLRIIRATNPDEVHPSSEHRWSLGPGGYRLDASRNMWDGSGLKVESTITDVAWCHGLFNHKILTGAKSGELIMWDLTRSSKFERKAKDHVRSVHKLAVSPLAQHYCVTGSADGDLRAWDIRDMQRSIMRIRNASAIRAMAFSPNPSSALQVIAGFENGSLLRLDLRLGQRGTIDRLPVAHSSSVTSMDWCLRDGEMAADTSSGLGWLVTSGLDKTVKIWDLTKVALDPPASGDARGSRKPSYTLHPSFPVRRVLWRPGYVCEVAVISNSNAEFGSGNFSELAGSNSRGTYASVLSPQSERVNRASATADRHKSTAGIGDAVEIWDARRGWIAKWSIRGSAIDGGVTDIAFRDSHALWASHSSGMFSQLDLRESIRPIDAIPRSAVAWEASGSLAFAVGSRDQWEVPYDDLRPDYRAAMSDKRKNTLIKALGDPKYQPQHQTLANFSDLDSFTGIETITKFARAYTIEGFSRLALCEMNAQTAFDVGSIKVAQVWSLMATALKNVVSDPLVSPTATAAITSNYAFPPVSSSRDTSTSTSRKRTPVSSASSSPRLHVGSLPPTSSRPPMGRRKSGDSSLSGGRRPSHLRKLSMTSSSLLSPTLLDSAKHVGEGALDSDEDDSSDGGTGDERTDDDDDDEAGGPVVAVTPVRMKSRSLSIPPAPSPLSREMEQESAGDDSSVSPNSTDVEGSRYQSPKSKSRSTSYASRLKASSRSSTTLASLRRESSHSSIQTVTATGEVSFHDPHGLKAEETIRDLRAQKSAEMQQADQEQQDSADLHKLSDRRADFVHQDEYNLHQITWEILRDTLRQFADEGDVQTCAMLALVAPEELRLQPRQILRYLESYIELLSRLQLYTTAAYIRKFCQTEEVRNRTLVETVIHTLCGKCRKAIVVSSAGQLVRGAYAFCSTCKAHCVTCAICRLPVRTLLFQCSICHHGGHQSCYRRYYMENSMVPMPGSVLTDETRGRRRARDQALNGPGEAAANEKRFGHPCVSGCGHWCWAANEET